MNIRLTHQPYYWLTSKGYVFFTEDNKDSTARLVGRLTQCISSPLDVVVDMGKLSDTNGFNVRPYFNSQSDLELEISHPELFGGGQTFRIGNLHPKNAFEIIKTTGFQPRRVINEKFELAFCQGDVNDATMYAYLINKSMPEYRDAWEGFTRLVKISTGRLTTKLIPGHLYCKGLDNVVSLVYLGEYKGNRLFCSLGQEWIGKTWKEVADSDHLLKGIMTSAKFPKYPIYREPGQLVQVAAKNTKVYDLGKVLVGTPNIPDVDYLRLRMAQEYLKGNRSISAKSAVYYLDVTNKPTGITGELATLIPKVVKKVIRDSIVFDPETIMDAKNGVLPENFRVDLNRESAVLDMLEAFKIKEVLENFLKLSGSDKTVTDIVTEVIKEYEDLEKKFSKDFGVYMDNVKIFPKTVTWAEKGLEDDTSVGDLETAIPDEYIRETILSFICISRTYLELASDFFTSLDVNYWGNRIWIRARVQPLDILTYTRDDEFPKETKKYLLSSGVTEWELKYYTDINT